MALKVLVAADSFKGSLTSFQFIKAVEDVSIKLRGEVHVIGLPLADGGEGTLDALEFVLGGERRTCKVEDPLGRCVIASYLVKNRIAFIEMAQSSGLTLLRLNERDPLRTSSFGLGQVLADALNQPDVDQIIVGIGGSATNDGGIGMGQALGIQALDADGNQVRRGGVYLHDIVSLNMDAMHPRLTSVPIYVMSDVQSPLCGPHGASRVYGPQKGASEDDIDMLDHNLLYLSKKLEQIVGGNIVDMPGAGAAGGVGAALVAICGATLKSGIDTVLDLVGFNDRLDESNLVITGEGRTDSQTKFGKAVLGVARRASSHKRDVVCISGALGNDIEYLYSSGVTALFSICSRPMSEHEAMTRAYELLYSTIENVLRLYMTRL